MKKDCLIKSINISTKYKNELLTITKQSYTVGKKYLWAADFH